MTVSLVVRRQSLASVGLVRLRSPARSATLIALLAAGWTVFQLALVMPVVEHATGTRQDMGDFADLQGNVGLLLLLLGLSWTLAAVGEELAFRGYLFTRVTDLVGTGALGVVVAVLLSSIAFALLHTEQGVVGVLITFFDAIFFAVLRLRFVSVWASVLAHGCNNTIGLTAFFLVGPVYALW
jgi:membrane protease YdiL (CAAX protease family)